MEVQNLDQSTPEMLADWLLDAELSLTKNNTVTKVETFAPATSWHKSLKAEQVHYYSSKRHFRCHRDVPCIRSTDDSDCKFVLVFLGAIHFSVSNNLHNYSKADEEDFDDRHNNADASSSSSASLTWYGSNDDNHHKAVPVCAPASRIVVHHHFPFFEIPLSRYTTSNNRVVKALKDLQYYDLAECAKRRNEASLATSREVR
jgi:hypothetical protein